MIEFASADPSVVRAVRQRELLNAWLRALGGRHGLPLRGHYQPDRIADELIDMMEFDVHGDGEQARFLITHEGARLTTTYGNEDVEPAKRTNRWLEDAIGPDRYGHVVCLYRACVRHRRPAYSISTVQDADGKDVAYERLLLPFGRDSRVEQIVGSYKTISIEGGFKVANLMGLRPRAVPEIKVRAIIDQDFVRRRVDGETPGDLIEIS
jgi:hypothetical protein